jgi:hypothetical protein
MGRFQAKTTAAWPLYLNARARQNLSPILEPDILAAYRTHAKGRTAATSLYQIVGTLRAHADPTWKTLAEAAINTPGLDPILQTEIEKILLADSKLFATDSPRPIAARALRLYRSADCSAKELISHAKAYVRHSLLSEESPDLNQLLRIATRRFPGDPALVHAIRHTACLAAMMAVKHDLARGWLHQLITDTSAAGDLEAWGKATWALARLSEDLENPGEASVWYFELAENNLTPPRFRIQAMLKGFRQLAASGGAVDTPKISSTISTILNTVDDYKLALDAARQLALAGPSFLNLKLQAAQRGKSLATTALQTASTSREKLAIIEYVARRQAWDLGDFTSILEQWDQHSAKERTEFEMISGSLWYEYVAILFIAFTRKNRISEAELLVANIIDRDRATPEGYVIVGTEYAEWLLKSGQKAKAFEYFDWIAKESPTHRRAAVAHYWIALRHLKHGEQSKAKFAAETIKACFGGVPALLQEWELNAKAELLLWEIADGLQQPPLGFSQKFSEEQSLIMKNELSSL